MPVQEVVPLRSEVERKEWGGGWDLTNNYRGIMMVNNGWYFKFYHGTFHALCTGHDGICTS